MKRVNRFSSFAKHFGVHSGRRFLMLVETMQVNLNSLVFAYLKTRFRFFVHFDND